MHSPRKWRLPVWAGCLSVVAVLAAPALAATTHYKGTVTENPAQKAKFNVAKEKHKGKVVKGAGIDQELLTTPSGDGCGAVYGGQGLFEKPAKLKNGSFTATEKFKYSQDGKPDVYTWQMKGTIKGSSASGTWTETNTLDGEKNCDIEVHWTATKQ